MEPWHDYLIAIAGASGALVGLLFVALSINLDQLIAAPHLLIRAGSNLAGLVSVLVIACLLLTPTLSLVTYGRWMVVLGGCTWLLVTILSLRSLQRAERGYRRFELVAIVTMQLATIPTILAGVMVWRQEENGLLWLVPAFLLTLVIALVNSWVLLVEARR